MGFTCTPILFNAAEGASEVIPEGASEGALNGALVVARAWL